MASVNLGAVTVTAFAGRLGEAFAVELEGEIVELVLREAKSLGAAPGEGRAPFSLLFEGPRERPLEQRIYPLRHAGLGVLEIFLVPLGLRGEGATYEAVFT